MIKSKIIGVGSYLPQKILTNHDFEKMVETSDEWIVTRTGMKERHIAEENEFASHMGIKAALKALDQANISPKDIDYILVATSTPDYSLPSTACIIQEGIGAKNSSALDIQAACTGYLYALSIAKSFVESGAYKNILVIAPEKLSSITNYKDRSTCILFGDGAAACIVSNNLEKPGFLLDNICLGADGQYAQLGTIPASGCRLRPSHKTIEEGLHYIHMSGNEVFKHAVRSMEAACRECLSRANLEENDISWLIPHQANKRIIDALAKRFEKLPNERVFHTIHKYGNTSAASIGISLSELIDSGALKSKEHILLTAFGFGFTWGAAIMTYQE